MPGLRLDSELLQASPHSSRASIKRPHLSSPVLDQGHHPAGAISWSLCLRELLLGDQWCVVRKWSHKYDFNTVSCLGTLMPHTQHCLQTQISEDVPL